MYVSANDHFIFDIALFWFIVKRKGITHDLDKELEWFHSFYDSI
jgi:hypothetical protein